MKMTGRKILYIIGGSMQIIMIVLTSAVISACLLYSYKLGYEKGMKEHKEGIQPNKYNAEMLKQYANFISYVGDERGE